MPDINDYIRAQINEASAADFSSKQAEQSIICRFLTKSAEAELYARELKESDFYYSDYGHIFRAMQNTLAKGMHIDLVTIDSALHEMYPDAYGMIQQAMMNCIDIERATFRNIEDYIRIVKDLSTRRQSIKSVENLAIALRDPTRDITEVLDQLRQENAEIQQSRHKWQTMTDVLLATYDYLERRQRGEIKSIATGIANIDRVFGGFFAGELTVVGARPSVGKSAFGANIALAAAQQGYKVGIISREMTDIQYGQRMLAHEAWIDGMQIRSADIDADAWARIVDSMSILGNLPIEFMFSVAYAEDLRMEVQRKVERGELDMIVIDYLGLMQTRRKFREENLRIGHICKLLKAIAVDCNIPVVALAQVNRDSDGQMPTLKNLKASGDIEQDADNVIFLHRPQFANDKNVDPRDREFFEQYEAGGMSYLCIGIAKQRQGAIGKACVLFDPAHMRYIEIERNKVPQE